VLGAPAWRKEAGVRQSLEAGAPRSRSVKTEGRGLLKGRRPRPASQRRADKDEQRAAPVMTSRRLPPARFAAPAALWAGRAGPAASGRKHPAKGGGG
jgi:hypothetical protein